MEQEPRGRLDKAPLQETDEDEGRDTNEEPPLGLGLGDLTRRDWTQRAGVRPTVGQTQEFLLRYKSEFPPFDYSYPKQWIVWCEKFFILSHVPRQEIVNLLYIHLTGRVGIWFESYVHSLRGGFQWLAFSDALCKRFGDSGVSLMEDFASFKQVGTIDDYTDEYEGFKSMLQQAHPTLTETYFLENYVARLRHILRCFVRTARPRGLDDAIWLARQNEKGLRTRHKCRGPTFNLLEDQEEGVTTESLAQVEEELRQEEAKVSLCAVVGGEGMNTLKLLGHIQKQPVVILVDSGSTHSFLDPKIMCQLRREPEKANPLVVTVANGERVVSDAVSQGLGWQIQQECFVKDFRLLKLGECDMVLGMDWVDQYAPIQLHTRPPGISFHKEGRKVLLRGLTKKVLLKAATEKQIKKWHKEGVHGFLVQCSEIPSTRMTEPPSLNLTQAQIPPHKNNQIPQTKHPELSQLLVEFQGLFDEPNILPPKRSLNHTIPLIPGAKPTNIGPYRYSFDKKNTIERMVEEMLTAGIITPSSSCFASPVLLVPKKDNSWRFCIDYRALNIITIKNKFPIPLVEELFSELAGATYFSMLDLRAGYHQIRMKEGEKFKTTFRTHQGLYEFKVMPFGLTNGPATFQSLMNLVFKPLIRKSVLVFFDDILIYSLTREDHWIHLREVLSIMKQHSLYAKLSKCSFAENQVEYLGHIISKDGLQTDPSKLDAVAAWPTPLSIKALRGFLGLAGYYRRFIKGYGIISKPLTDMLKKDAFHWSTESMQAFEALKKALCNPLVLALPDFHKEFVVEADASYNGMGAVLIQEKRPIAFFSKAFGVRHLGLSIYEKEFLSILNAVDKWRPYLLVRHFVIKTDHHSLQFLLGQKITSTLQQKGLTKLLGLDYTIQYKKGTDNIAADALSRRDVSSEVEYNAISAVQPLWMEEISKSYDGDVWATENLTSALIVPVNDPRISVSGGMIRYKDRLYVGSSGSLRRDLMLKLHVSAIWGHAG
ncbi:PREDICTED: uncharacterized protein LOC109191615 [Ipomoea nil]|uniref:uncharacterized protein LOC109191615 n=1 Tax=Ipomoea nil TaxID=35883 RepID=UPI000900C0D2|nr:PREDICTED: uncharacterized protein LOC109191615 [Ipomoea nil]